jgi:N-acetylated-alpha-linked acidic dipeptidase
MTGLLTARGIILAGALLAAAACAGHKAEIPTAAAPPDRLTGFAPGDVREQLDLEERFRTVPSGKSARGHLLDLAARVRPAGSAAGREAAEWAVEQFEAAGLDAGLWEFQAPLPLLRTLRLTLLEPGGREVDITPGEDGSPPPFLAFSPSASLEAMVVDAGDGGWEDFLVLLEDGVTIQGHAVLVRRDRSRALSEQVDTAAHHGAAAVLVAPEAGSGLPADAVRRGALLPQHAGIGSSIPALALGDRETARLTSALESATPVRLEMEIEPEPRTAVNAMARVVGTDWPEELVVLGAPRDAWVHGAGRSASGVASLLEVAHGLGALLKNGWQPRRTILLAAWDASLFGQAGSTAWAEQSPFDMESAAVAYLNAGAGMSGPAFRLASSPELRVLLSEIIPAGLEILPPDGRGDDRVFLQMGVATAEVGRPEGSGNVAGTAHDTFRRLEEQVDPDMAGPVEGARLWGQVALRMTEAAVPPHNHAVTAYRLLADLDGLLRLAREMFDDNPPPVSGLRLALVDLREAAEAWNAAAAAYLASAGSIPRGDRAGEIHRRLGQAGSLVRSVDRAFVRSPDAGTEAGCESLLVCPDPRRHEPARSLPGLRAATAERNRSDFVSEALRLTSAAQVATARLREAAELLGAARPEPSDGSRLEKLLKKEKP